MAKRTKQQLIEENKRLQAELVSAKKANRSTYGKIAKMTAKWLAFALACALLVVANLSFYMARTVVETDKFMQVASPLIRRPAVQDALADKMTKTIYSQIDAEQLIASSLPAQLAPLAPTLSTQLQKFTYDKSKEILASEGFQSTYDQVLEKTHSAFIQSVRNYEGDGTISINDVYATLSQRLQDSKLSFLADKQLPDRIGSIQVLKADWLPVAHNAVVNLDAVRAATAGLVLALLGVFFWLSQNRRRALIQLSVAIVAVGTATVVAVNAAGSLFVDQAKNYPAAAEEIWDVFSAPLIEQTIGAIALALAVGLVAWAGGSSKSALKLKKRGSDLLSGKLHKSLFQKENGLTHWVGKYKKYLHIAIGIGFILAVATVEISWGSFVGAGLIFLALGCLVELLAADRA